MYIIINNLLVYDVEAEVGHKDTIGQVARQMDSGQFIQCVVTMVVCPCVQLVNHT